MSETMLQKILEELKEMNVEVKGMKTEQQLTNQRLTSLETKQQQTNQRLETIETKQQQTNQRLDTIKTEQTLIKQAVLETNDIVHRLELNQEKHERILDLLSRRSIEQEAELKKMK